MFKAYLTQKSEGCDYTINCGSLLIDVEGSTFIEAEKTLRKL